MPIVKMKYFANYLQKGTPRRFSWTRCQGHHSEQLFPVHVTHRWALVSEISARNCLYRYSEFYL